MRNLPEASISSGREKKRPQNFREAEKHFFDCQKSLEFENAQTFPEKVTHPRTPGRLPEKTGMVGNYLQNKLVFCSKF